MTNSIGMDLVLIPAGQFMMGSPDSDPDAYDDEKPLHRVTISQSFYVGQHPVTQAQWQAMMGANPSRFTGADRPVECVSWDDAQAFIEKLNEREGARHYRLLLEAEWEYACRAGTTTRYSFSNYAARLGQFAWYDKNAKDKTYPVGRRRPNPWGLYDMLGNVWEWCQDWYGAYCIDATTDPQGPCAGAARVLRGGSWIDHDQDMRCALRYGDVPGSRYGFNGFRIARDHPFDNA